MATSKDAKSFRIDDRAELLNSFLGQICAVLDVNIADVSQERGQKVFSIASRAAIVDKQEAEPLHEKQLATTCEHVVV